MRSGTTRSDSLAPKTLPAECPYSWDEILNRPFAFDDDR
jgi:hypothetical protein